MLNHVTSASGLSRHFVHKDPYGYNGNAEKSKSLHFPFLSYIATPCVTDKGTRPNQYAPQLLGSWDIKDMTDRRRTEALGKICAV